MQAICDSKSSSGREVDALNRILQGPPVAIEVALLTGGQDRHYSFGLAMALASKGICLDIIGSDEVDSPELHAPPALNFFNLRKGQQANPTLGGKLSRILL